jgi:signal-transduction protein with cAMP-binding, CBS, and nucleotidyltransferase domain
MTPAFFEPAPLSSKEIAELIEGTRWSDKFSWQDILMLAKYCVAYYEPAGTTLVREGDTERRVRIRKDEGFGGSRVIAQLGQGQAFGEMALFDAEPRSATVEAETDTTLVRLSTEDFDRLIREVPELGIKLITKIASLMSQRLRQTSGRLVEALADD